MNYCDKIQYHIYTTGKASFEKMVDALLAHLPGDEQLFRLVFFGRPEDNKQYLAHCGMLRDKVRSCCGSDEPAWSYVSQPPLSAGMIVEVHSYKADPGDHITYGHYDDLPYVVLKNEDGRFLFAGGFQGEVMGSGILLQSQEVFREIGNVLQKEDFPQNSIIRQWNYMERIISFDGVNQHYQIFNNARSEFYGQTEWRNGYPAATGIGAHAGGILVDFDAVVFSRPECYATPIDNKLQIAAHAYSNEVLAVAHQKKTTPKFERAKSMTFDGRSLIYISGTAAIRGEESLLGSGLEHQLRITMENIGQLTGEVPLRMLRVYLKKEAYYEETRRLLEKYELNIPILYVLADVCREELLIEIEGIAV